MPVMVVGAQRALGHSLSAALRDAGGEVRVFLEADASNAAQAASWRSAGYKTARGALDDEAHLEGSLEQVHTVVHAGGEPLDHPADVLDELAGVLSAAIGAGCRRFVWASQIAAADPRGNPFLQACAQAEELLADAPLETVVIRRDLTYGPGDPLTAALARGGLGRRSPAAPARHRPLFVGDLATAVVVADRERRHTAGLHVVLAMAGPQTVALGEFARLLGAPPRLRGPGLPGHVVDLLARNTPEEVTAGRTSLAAGLAALRG
jgi:nucleoside-diphosphate-sugar epimerase